MVYAYGRNEHIFKHHRITEAYLCVMRLRLTWLMLCTTKRIQPSEYNLAKLQKIDEEISNIPTPPRHERWRDTTTQVGDGLALLTWD
ncbi:hypothetical protein JG688_00004880 [Phytophthora aleatoria]|uniref:Uncharacterized protein n=1 Tax=Phytophthora aleatoria TaxID=2496075 RepID=A0A8J5MB08_9STRA|nr:hypothetical protein JG688_00004880 [Phytophthora aleatoria]